MKVSSISSKDNTRIKHLKKLLADRAYRYEHRRYVLEGVRALDGLSLIDELFVREGSFVPDIEVCARYDVSPYVFDAVADTGQSQGIMAICTMPEVVDPIDPQKMYLLLDHIQDPGNMGTMIRTACAFGFQGVLLSEGCTDPYSPKAARSAMGALHKIGVRSFASVEELAGFTLVVGDATGEPLSSFRWPASFVLCVGSEAHGVSAPLRAIAHHTVSIPILPVMESLNAAVAAGIMSYDASRKNGDPHASKG